MRRNDKYVTTCNVGIRIVFETKQTSIITQLMLCDIGFQSRPVRSFTKNRQMIIQSRRYVYSVSIQKNIKCFLIIEQATNSQYIEPRTNSDFLFATINDFFRSIGL
ncbi:hypothetical protein LMBIIBHN_00035 [Aeromonas salmonicida]